MPRDDCAEQFRDLEAAASRQAAEESAGRALAAARVRLILGRDARSAFFATLALRQVRGQFGDPAIPGRVCPRRCWSRRTQTGLTAYFWATAFVSRPASPSARTWARRSIEYAFIGIPAWCRPSYPIRRQGARGNLKMD